MRTENAIKEMQRQEELRKLQEQQQNKMAADEPAVASWPDDGFQPSPQTGMDRVAGALRVGKAGDAAFARDLLNSGQAPLGGVSKPESAADGVRENAAGSRAAKPALGLG